MMMVSVAVVMMCFSSLIHREVADPVRTEEFSFSEELPETLGNEIEKYDNK